MTVIITIIIIVTNNDMMHVSGLTLLTNTVPNNYDSDYYYHYNCYE